MFFVLRNASCINIGHVMKIMCFVVCFEMCDLRIHVADMSCFKISVILFWINFESSGWGPSLGIGICKPMHAANNISFLYIKLLECGTQLEWTYLSEISAQPNHRSYHRWLALSPPNHRSYLLTSINAKTVTACLICVASRGELSTRWFVIVCKTCSALACAPIANESPQF